jgi:hypothetical protein
MSLCAIVTITFGQASLTTKKSFLNLTLVRLRFRQGANVKKRSSPPLTVRMNKLERLSLPRLIFVSNELALTLRLERLSGIIIGWGQANSLR